MVEKILGTDEVGSFTYIGLVTQEWDSEADDWSKDKVRQGDKGQCIWDNDKTYEGDWKANKPHGHGKLTYKSKPNFSH